MSRRAAFPAIVALGLTVPSLALAAAADAAGMMSLLSLGFVVGLAHALDADHVAAVAALMDRRDGRRGAMARGMVWGLGHTLALFAICSTALLLGLSISGRTEAALELAVGVMIVVLGLRVLWKMDRDRIHIHVHEHDGRRHAHLHSHAGETGAHAASGHAHTHRARALMPTLGVGLLHGAAGSAGLLVLIVATAPGTGAAMAAFAVFGVGSLLGMTALTAVASYPLALIGRGGGWMRTTLAAAIGGLALFVGGSVVAESLNALSTAGLH